MQTFLQQFVLSENEHEVPFNIVNNTLGTGVVTYRYSTYNLKYIVQSNNHKIKLSDLNPLLLFCFSFIYFRNITFSTIFLIFCHALSVGLVIISPGNRNLKNYYDLTSVNVFSLMNLPVFVVYIILNEQIKLFVLA